MCWSTPEKKLIRYSKKLKDLVPISKVLSVWLFLYFFRLWSVQYRHDVSLHATWWFQCLKNFKGRDLKFFGPLSCCWVLPWCSQSYRCQSMLEYENPPQPCTWHPKDKVVKQKTSITNGCEVSPKCFVKCLFSAWH